MRALGLAMDPGRALTAVLALALLVPAAAIAADQRAPKSPFPTVPPQSKRFTVVEEYNFVERDYQPSLLLPRLSQAPTAKLQYPEDALVSQMSAIAALDYDWWLSTFDAESQETIKAKVTDANATADTWKKRWKDKGAKVRVLLTRWIISGDYVILAYRVSDSPEAQISQQPEVAQAFRLTPEGWRATLKLADDPVVLHFADPQDRFEMVVRP